MPAAAAGAIDRHLMRGPMTSGRVAMAWIVLHGFECQRRRAGDRSRATSTAHILKRNGAMPRCRREMIRPGFDGPTPILRVGGVAGLHPDVKIRADLLPLPGDPEAEVRRAALVAVASGTDDDLGIADEDLFRWLHDPDAGVRRVCHEVLVSRERTETEIALGRRLTDPDSGERLKLLLDLRYEDDVADPEPWLERLSRDIEPAVRAGAARVAAELTTNRRQSCPPWVTRVAEADPDPTVRRAARYFRTIPQCRGRRTATRGRPVRDDRRSDILTRSELVRRE